jgi:phage terminase Nu1 subunit (DNA packaging protein)
MTPSEQCKKAGLKSLAELAEISGESVQTLNNWHKSGNAVYRRRFELLLKGAIFERTMAALEAATKP